MLTLSYMHLYEGTNTNIWFHLWRNGCFLWGIRRKYLMLLGKIRLQQSNKHMQTWSLITFRNFSMQASYYPLNTFYLVIFFFFLSVGSASLLVFPQCAAAWFPTAKAASAAVTCRLEVSLLVGVRMGGGGLCRCLVLLGSTTLGVRARRGRTLQPS